MFEHHQLYVNPLKNASYVVYQHVANCAFSVISTICNGTLVALILRYEKKNEFGAYRYLLLTFAIVDLYYGWVHFLIQPIPEAWANVCYMAAHGYVTGKIAVCFYATAHSHSFVVLVFHFLYRLLAVRGSTRLRLFSEASFYGVIVGCCAAVGGSWFYVMYWLYDTDDFVIEYMRPILQNYAISSSQDVNNYSIAVFWKYGTFDGPRWGPILGISIMSATMMGAYSIMMYATSVIVRLMKANAASQSKKTREMTRQLMKALLFQTILPIITAYSPPLVSVVVPFFGLHFPFVADLSPLFCGIHPIIDACTIIYLIKPYRTLLLQWLQCDRATKTISISKTSTKTVSGAAN